MAHRLDRSSFHISFRVSSLGARPSGAFAPVRQYLQMSAPRLTYVHSIPLPEQPAAGAEARPRPAWRLARPEAGLGRPVRARAVLRLVALRLEAPEPSVRPREPQQ